MANTRYTNIITQFDSDLRIGRGRDITTAQKDSFLTIAQDYVYGRNPDGWPFVRVQFTSSASRTESLPIRADTGSADAEWEGPLPIFNTSVWIVKTQVGGTTGDWVSLDYEPWSSISRTKSRYNRTATTTLNQETFSLKANQTVTATKRPTSTLETYPYSYASLLDAQKLYYQVDYWRQTPTIVSGADADDSLLHDAEMDLIILYIAESMAAHQINDSEAMERAWFLARTFLDGALRRANVPAHRIILPPPWIKRDPTVNTEGD